MPAAAWGAEPMVAVEYKEISYVGAGYVEPTGALEGLPDSIISRLMFNDHIEKRVFKGVVCKPPTSPKPQYCGVSKAPSSKESLFN